MPSIIYLLAFVHTDDKLSLKWVWPRHVTHFKLLVPLRYLWNGLS